MRRTTVWLSMVVFAFVASAGPAFAIKPTTKPPKPTVTKTQAPKSTTKAPKSSAPKASKSTAPKSAKATAPKGSSKKISTTTASTTTTTSPTTPIWTNDVAKKLSTKPNHLAKLESALGLGTLTPEQINGATSGFKNFGQLNAAVNTSLNNPNVDFAQLKALMTGQDMKGQPIPGQTTTYSLGQAKQRLGLADYGTTSPTTTTSSTTTKTKKRPNATSGGTQ
jgi:hypothetical protein